MEGIGIARAHVAEQVRQGGTTQHYFEYSGKIIPFLSTVIHHLELHKMSWREREERTFVPSNIFILPLLISIT